jgi:ATP-dependent Lon protease
MAEADRDDLISIIEEEDKTTEIPTVLPMLPVRDVVVFTDMLLPLFVGRENRCARWRRPCPGSVSCFWPPRNTRSWKTPRSDEIYHTGTVGRVLRMLKLPDGRMKVLVQGVAKARQDRRYVRKKSPYRVQIELLPKRSPLKAVTIETEALMRNVRESSRKRSWRCAGS